MLKRHQCIWDHERPFYDYDDGGLALRTYRAINWTHRARQEPDHFAAFLFFWIAFNSLYDAGGGGRGGEDERRAFLNNWRTAITMAEYVKRWVWFRPQYAALSTMSAHTTPTAKAFP